MRDERFPSMRLTREGRVSHNRRILSIEILVQRLDDQTRELSGVFDIQFFQNFRAVVVHGLL